MLDRSDISLVEDRIEDRKLYDDEDRCEDRIRSGESDNHIKAKLTKSKEQDAIQDNQEDRNDEENTMEHINES